MKTRTNLLQEEISKLKSQLMEVEQNKLNQLEGTKVHTNRLEECLKVMQKKVKDSEDMRVHTNILQEENAELKSQLDVKIKLLERKKTRSKLQEQPENSEVFASSLNKKISELKQLEVKQKPLESSEDAKVHTEILQDENSKLISQLELIQQQLDTANEERMWYLKKYRSTNEEKMWYYKKYRELKYKETSNIAIQTDMVCC